MLIGIMSDSHDNLVNIKKAVALFNDKKVGLVIHCGDFVSPFIAQEFEKLDMKLVGVFGNNDGDKPYLLERFAKIGELHQDPFEINIAGRKIVIMHQPKFIDELIACNRYDVVIYGHTHKIDIRKDKSLAINPGETGGWLTGKSSVVILDTQTLSPQLVYL